MIKKSIVILCILTQLILLSSCKKDEDSHLDTVVRITEASEVISEISSADFQESSMPESVPSSSQTASQSVSDIKKIAEKPANQIKVKGKDITKDKQYIPTEKELETEDPGYIKKPDDSVSQAPPDTPSVKPPPVPVPPASTSSTQSSSAASSLASSADASSSVSSAVPEPSSGSSSAASSAPLADGWQVINGKTYYYTNGAPLKGMTTFGDRKYFFDNSGVLKSRMGIDVSYYQAAIDWDKVKADGIEFAFIRVGFRGYGTEGNLKIDSRFSDHVKNARKANIKIGVYFYTQAITTDEAVQEANLVLRTLTDVGLKPSDLDYPVVYDIEEVPASNNPRTLNLNNTQRTDFCIAFAETVKNKGYKPMIYSNKYWLTSRLDTRRLSSYDIWLAHYMSPLSKNTDYTGAYKVWQYTDKGTVNGIGSNVDLNISLY